MQYKKDGGRALRPATIGILINLSNFPQSDWSTFTIPAQAQLPFSFVKQKRKTSNHLDKQLYIVYNHVEWCRKENLCATLSMNSQRHS